MSKPIEDAADIISQQNALIEELQAKLAAQAAPVVAASELTDEQIYKFWLYRDCMDAIQAGDMKAQFISAARAMPAAAAPAASVAVPAGHALVPVEATPEIMAAAAIAAWPTASSADIELARKAAAIVLMQMDTGPGVTLDMLAATLATMAPAYRAMIAAAPAPGLMEAE